MGAGDDCAGAYCLAGSGRLVLFYRAYAAPEQPTETWAFSAPDGAGGSYQVGGYASRSEAQRAADAQRSYDESRGDWRPV